MMSISALAMFQVSQKTLRTFFKMSSGGKNAKPCLNSNEVVLFIPVTGNNQAMDENQAT